MGRPFDIAVSWPTDMTEYSSDWQTGANYWGSYRTESISIAVNVPGFDFSVPPSIAEWQTYNDAILDYQEGIPQLRGDELRLDSRVDWFRDWTISPSETLSSVTPLIITLRAVDTTGTHFVDDSLQTHFDLASFTKVQFEFLEIVPVAGNDPRPISYQHWIGTIQSIVAVPEPTSGAMASLVVFSLYAYRRRTNGCSGAA